MADFSGRERVGERERRCRLVNSLSPRNRDRVGLGHPGSQKGHPGSPKGHPRSPRGHPRSTRGILGHPGVTLFIQGSPCSSRGHPGSPRGSTGGRKASQGYPRGARVSEREIERDRANIGQRQLVSQLFAQLVKIVDIVPCQRQS